MRQLGSSLASLTTPGHEHQPEQQPTKQPDQDERGRTLARQARQQVERGEKDRQKAGFEQQNVPLERQKILPDVHAATDRTATSSASTGTVAMSRITSSESITPPKHSNCRKASLLLIQARVGSSGSDPARDRRWLTALRKLLAGKMPLLPISPLICDCQRRESDQVDHAEQAQEEPARQHEAVRTDVLAPEQDRHPVEEIAVRGDQAVEEFREWREAGKILVQPEHPAAIGRVFQQAENRFCAAVGCHHRVCHPA